MSASRKKLRATKRRSQPNWFVIAISVLIVVGIGAIALTRSGQRGGGDVEPPQGVRSVNDLEREHTEDPVEYDVTPPVGGSHSSLPQTCAFYDADVRSENAVHSLEHGAVWITYSEELDEDEIDVLRGLAEDNVKVLVTEWKGELPANVIASAWGKQLRLSSATDDRLQRFIDVFEDAATAPEPGAACQGIGQPAE